MSVVHKSPTGIGANKSSVAKFAEDIATQVAFQPGGNIEELIERIGGKIVIGTSGSGDAESGSIVAASINDFTIFVSRHTSLKRDRFTIAHELGHLLLHLGPIKAENPDAWMRATRWVDMQDKGQQRAEWEANWFAASFLMPENAFRTFHAEGGLTRAQQECDVSASAAEIRAKSLGLPQ